MKQPFLTKIRAPRLRLPVVAGVIDRRLLINFRCDPNVLQNLVPPPFRPKIVNGWGMAGICLIRLTGLRPAFTPALSGFASENAAHRIAVQWDENKTTKEGVFIPRRDTNALLNRFLGGRLFAGIHHAARFESWETPSRFKIEMRSNDGATFVRVSGSIAASLPRDSVFRSLAEASEFFQAGSMGWSPARRKDTFDGMELCCADWRMEPLAIDHVSSSFFDNKNLFPPGAAKFDSAFLMRNLSHEWRSHPQLLIEDAL